MKPDKTSRLLGPPVPSYFLCGRPLHRAAHQSYRNSLFKPLCFELLKLDGISFGSVPARLMALSMFAYILKISYSFIHRGSQEGVDTPLPHDLGTEKPSPWGRLASIVFFYRVLLAKGVYSVVREGKATGARKIRRGLESLVF